MPLYAAEFQPKYVADAAAICVERPEEMGRSNIEPVTAIIDPGVELMLLGGYAACAYLPAGTHSIVLRYSTELARPTSSNEPQTTQAKLFSTMIGSTTVFELCGSYALVTAGSGTFGPGGCVNNNGDGKIRQPE